MKPENTTVVTRSLVVDPYRYVHQERTPKPLSRRRALAGERFLARATVSRDIWLPWALAGVGLAALGLGIGSLLQVDVAAIGALGLITALPPGYFIALALSLTGFVASLGLRKAYPALLVMQILVVIILLQGADPIVHGLPRLEASYRHLGIADYIAQTGQFDPKLDAYFNWPGFFALLAMLSRATGVANLSGVATWAPIGVDILLLVPLLALALRLTSNWRHAWASVWMFYLTIWVGQDYMSPQACAFLLMVILLGCLLACFGGWSWPVAKHRLMRQLRRITVALDPTAHPHRRGVFSRRDAVVLGLGCAIIIVAMTAAHQLTPFAVVPVLAAFLFTGRLRLRALALMAAVFPVVWLAIVAAPYTVGHVNALFGSFGAIGETTAKAVTGRIAGDEDHLLVVNVRLVETGLVALLGVVGAVVARMRRVPWLTAALGAGTPVALYVVQPYGGELLLRLYMYGLPFATSLMVLPLMRRSAAPLGWLRGIGLLLLGGLLAGTTLVSRYGNDLIENFTPDELNVVNRLYEVAPSGSVLIEAVHNTPWRSQEYAGYDYQTLLSARAQPTDTRLSCAEVETLAKTQGAYLIVTRSQIEEADLLGVGPKGDVSQFLNTCGDQPGWSLLYQNAGGVIYHIEGTSKG